MKIICKTATNIANIGEEQEILSYNATTGLITLTGPGFTAHMTAGDTFILIPVTAQNVVDFIGNSAVSTMNLFAEVSLADEGTYVQISSLTDGSDGKVNVTGGTANALVSDLTISGSGFDLWVENALWQVGMQVSVEDSDTGPLATYIEAVTPDNPVAGTYKITLHHNVSAYTTGKDATITRTEVLDFDTAIVQGLDAYKYYTGLLRRVQKTVDGVESDQSFPGIKAAGTQIEVIAPTVQKLTFEVDITLEDGISISNIIDDVKNGISSYVNALKVGEDVILSEIIRRVKGVIGIKDVSITTPSSNVAIADIEVARVSDNDIIIG
jgi:phage-related baseplate assembly protein